MSLSLPGVQQFVYVNNGLFLLECSILLGYRFGALQSVQCFAFAIGKGLFLRPLLIVRRGLKHLRIFTTRAQAKMSSDDQSPHVPREETLNRLSTEIWGNADWRSMAARAKTLPIEPSPDQQENAYLYLSGILYSLPCSACAEKTIGWIHPETGILPLTPDVVSSGPKMEHFVYSLRQLARQSLGQKIESPAEYEAYMFAPVRKPGSALQVSTSDPPANTHTPSAVDSNNFWRNAFWTLFVVSLVLLIIWIFMTYKRHQKIKRMLVNQGHPKQDEQKTESVSIPSRYGLKQEASW